MLFIFGILCQKWFEGYKGVLKGSGVKREKLNIKRRQSDYFQKDNDLTGSDNLLIRYLKE